MKKIIYKSNSAQRIDKYLTDKLLGFSRSQVQKMIKAGQVTVKQKKVSPHYQLKPDDLINLAPNAAQEKPIYAKIKLEVKAETGSYLVLEKPSGVVIHPDPAHPQGTTLIDAIIKKFPEIKSVGEDPIRPGIVHRLDKDASGLTVVARNQEMFHSLKQQFKQHSVIKKYSVLVHGSMNHESGEINLAIGRTLSKKKKGRQAARALRVTGKEKEALTKYRVIKKFNNFSLLEVQTLTGRTHQIRVHLFSIGHPLVGDTIYKTKKLKEKTTPGRLFLHATFLSFQDLAGTNVSFTSPLAEKLKNFLNKLA